MERQTFVCEICGHEVIENDSAESLQGSQDRMMRFNHQMRFIREGLRKTEDMVLPAYVFRPVDIRNIVLTNAFPSLVSTLQR